MLTDKYDYVNWQTQKC